MPDSKINKKIKNAELHLKRAEQRNADPETIADKREALQALLTEKEIGRWKAGGSHA